MSISEKRILHVFYGGSHIKKLFEKLGLPNSTIQQKLTGQQISFEFF